MMKKIYKYSSGAFAFILLMACLNCTIAVMARDNNSNNSQKLPLQSDTYIPGVITIKVKEGIGPFGKQTSNIQFGVSSLDKLVHEYEVNSLDKRFRHKPIAKNSGMPALDRIYKIEFPEHKNVWAVANGFAADPNVEYAEPIFLHHPTDVPDDPMYDLQQHLPQIMASEAWDIHKGEDGSDEIIIAIVDSGVDWYHPDLTDNCWQNTGEDADGDGVTIEFNNGIWELDPGDLNGIDDDGNGYTDDLIGWDFWEEVNGGNGSNPDPYPHSHSHGTHCAGIAAGVTNNGTGISSISYNLKYMPTKVDNGNNSFWYPYEAIIYSAENGADIISNSWGGNFFSQANQDVIDYAVSLGSIVVVAGMNDNTNSKAYPAAYHGSIAVAALEENDTRASFSNYGIWIDISAPGVGILSTVVDNDYQSWNGTSMATPIVAGLLGLLKSYRPDWTNEDLINQVIGTADDIDGLNPGYENALGDGRINAYHTLVDQNVVPQQELKFEFTSFEVNDSSDDGVIEAGESASIDIQMRNYSQLVSSDNVTFTVSTADQNVTITSGSTLSSVPADSEFEVENVFEFTANESALCSEVVFLVEVTADMEITFGQNFYIKVIIANSGILVWDGELDDVDYSGAFISGYLEEQGYDVLYTDIYPESFSGFDAVFLSFANSGETQEEAAFFTYEQSLVIQDYLESGGNVYTEGMSQMYRPKYFAWTNKDELWNLFGVADVALDVYSPHPVTKLIGNDNTIAEGMVFDESNQVHNWFIDTILPAAGAYVPFVEENLGNVSIYNEGSSGHKAFYFGYTLADLVNTSPHSSRYHILTKIMDFFGFSVGSDYVVANFVVDITDALPGEEIQFTDWSVSDEGYEIVSWAWDFNEDGLIDSEDQNPVWSYETGGNYDIMLVVSNGQSTDTLVRKDVLLIRSGIFVFEGEENEVDQSGSFIRDYLLSGGYDVVYANSFPTSLIGFDAVFASFGSNYFFSPTLNDEIANTIKSYGMEGGRIYLEGSEVLGSDQESNAFLWYIFGIEDVVNGSMNDVDLLQGQESTIMEGMEFYSSSQFDVYSIDKYLPFEATTTAHVTFEESDYGEVAVQFDGTDIFGQKTFCMSYSLANLEDGSHPNTRNEFLKRILEFFDVATDINEDIALSGYNLKLYPNPARANVTLAIELETEMKLSVEIYNLAGQLLIWEPEKLYQKGLNEVQFETQSLDAGTYIFRVRSSTEVFSGKLLHIN